MINKDLRCIVCASFISGVFAINFKAPVSNCQKFPAASCIDIN